MDWLLQHPTILLRLVATVAALFAAWYLHRRRKGLKWWADRSTVAEYLASEGRQESVGVDPARLQHMHRTLIFLWNDSRSAISPMDVEPLDPLRIEAADGARILSCRVLKQWGPWVGARVGFPDSRGSRAPVTFSVLRPRDGVLLRVIHQGEEPEAIAIAGSTIRGRPRILTGTPDQAAASIRELKRLTGKDASEFADQSATPKPGE